MDVALTMSLCTPLSMAHVGLFHREPLGSEVCSRWGLVAVAVAPAERLNRRSTRPARETVDLCFGASGHHMGIHVVSAESL